MERELIRRSNRGLIAQIITTAIVAFILGLIGSWLIGVVFSWAPNTEQLFTRLLWLAAFGVWGFQAIAQWSSWKGKRYDIGPDAIGVHVKAGMWGSTQTYYRYESIISVRMTQGFWGKRYNFGDVHITIPKLDRDVILRDIENPNQQLRDLQARMTERSGNSSHLVT